MQLLSWHGILSPATKASCLRTLWGGLGLRPQVQVTLACRGSVCEKMYSVLRRINHAYCSLMTSLPKDIPCGGVAEGVGGQRPGIVCPGVASSDAHRPVAAPGGSEQGERVGVSLLCCHVINIFRVTMSEPFLFISFYVSSLRKHLRCEVQARKVMVNFPPSPALKGEVLHRSLSGERGQHEKS